MALGDDALAAGMDIVDPESDRREGANEITKTRDYIAQFHALALGEFDDYVAKSAVVSNPSSGPFANLIPKYTSNAELVCNSPAAANHATPKSYVDSAVNSINLSNYVAKTGNHTMSGNLGVNRLDVSNHVYVPNSTAAVSSFTVAYINGDGRLSRGSSSERYKKFISDIDPLELGDLFPPLKRYQMRNGDGVWRYGYTAEQLAADPVTEPFVVYLRHVEEDGTAPHLERDEDGNPIPDSIDFIGLLLAQNAQLHALVKNLTERVEQLEAAK